MSEEHQPCLPNACISVSGERKHDVLKKVHYIGVEFDEKKIKNCEMKSIPIYQKAINQFVT